ncbi:uncharacterized protein BX664DRAFT_320077 [Halteromyces radiatus]|uniref:uncharacterized protein n=1 Tax=Halteromyces radiatus TaxID=101107 RepID=UPI00221F8FF3|nr:uncharacterized protein BX664DRAFT_320077 [Halteromyces radiatus]KAI8098975.1 hypothetical protein BX664DRAFT_320077 [Halteromyces radiatus]
MTISDIDDDDSYAASINHPTFIKKLDSSTVSSISSSRSSLGHSSRNSSHVTGIHHPSYILSPTIQQHTSATRSVASSSSRSFPYNDLEQELLQDTSIPDVDNSALSSRPNPLLTTSSRISSHRHHSTDEEASVNLFDDYSSTTRQRLEQSFADLFDRHALVPSQHENDSKANRSVMDIMETRCLRMEEVFHSRIQMLEDQIQQKQEHEQCSPSSLRQDVSQERSSNIENDQDKSTGEQSNIYQRIQDLEHFVDRVEKLVQETPWMPPTINTAHVCERHQAWSERVLKERPIFDSMDGPYSPERLEATFNRLIQWSYSLRSIHRH